MTAPVLLADVLDTPADRWVLLGSAGLWCADCLVPGCGWTTTTGSCEATLIAATVHALTHPAPTPSSRRTP